MVDDLNSALKAEAGGGEDVWSYGIKVVLSKGWVYGLLKAYQNV
jgi:hypothetical protein